MKTELFRKVQCSERLPGKENLYDTDLGTCIYNSLTEEWVMELQGEDMTFVCEPEYWLEPVEPVSVDVMADIIYKEWYEYRTKFIGRKAIKLLTMEINGISEKAAQAIHDLIYGKEKEG